MSNENTMIAAVAAAATPANAAQSVIGQGLPLLAATPLMIDPGQIAAARTEGETAGRLAATTEIATALTALMPDDKRLATFAEALTDGASVAMASKFASRIDAAAAPAPVTHRLDGIVPDPKVDAAAPEDAAAAVAASWAGITDALNTEMGVTRRH